MENNIDIKELWQKQAVPVVDRSDVLKKINRFKRNRIKKTIYTNAILLATIALAVFVWAYFEPQLITTKIGISLSVLPMGIAVVFNYKLILRYKTIDERDANQDYLNNLLMVKEQERFTQSKVLNIYFILLSAGIGLYLYEYAWIRSLQFGIAAYSLILLWVGFNWFFIRPKMIKKNNRKFEELIAQIKAIKLQIEHP